MNIAESTYNPDGMIAIAMNPKNGEILGMSSRPSFDPADFQSVSVCITEIYLYGVRMSLVQHLRSLHQAAALNENLVDLEKDTFYDDGAA